MHLTMSSQWAQFWTRGPSRDIVGPTAEWVDVRWRGIFGFETRLINKWPHCRTTSILDNLTTSNAKLPSC